MLGWRLIAALVVASAITGCREPAVASASTATSTPQPTSAASAPATASARLPDDDPWKSLTRDDPWKSLTRDDWPTALGPRMNLTAEQIAAFTPGDDFAPMPKPGPSDWLTFHQEPGQTFPQFVWSKPNRPSQQRQTLYFQPIGWFDENAPPLKVLEEYAAIFFGLEVKRLPVLDPAPYNLTRRKAPIGGHNQFKTGSILDLLYQRLPDDAYALIGMTMADLYPDNSWNFVFGEAMLRERVGIYSFVRYDPVAYGEKPGPGRQQKILERSLKVMTHEVSHMFGIEHCTHYHCLANGNNHVAEMDAMPQHLCPVCLRKLQWAVRFDPIRRDERLLEFYTRHDMTTDAAWTEQRLKHVRAALGR